MEHAPQGPWDPGALLAHERWAWRLARALVSDTDEADEILQQARLSFWRRGPEHPGRVRSWLGTVVRNLARTRSRKLRRHRASLTEIASTAEPVPSADELATRLETHRLLAALVGELREPLRETILLRYYEGLTAADIARRLQVPAGTVRWRTKTALAELRVRLDERHDGRRKAWLAVLVPMSRAEGGPRTAPPASGPLVFGVVGLASVLIGVVLLVRMLGEPRREPRSETGSNTLASLGTSVKTAPGRRSTPTFRVVPSAGPAAGEVTGLPQWALGRGFPSRTIAGRVTVDGQPIAGAQLRLSAGMFTQARELDRHAASRPDGRFSFPEQEPTNWFLTASAPGREPRILYVDLRATTPRVAPDQQAPDQLHIELPPCQVFAAGVVRSASGNVIADAQVKLTRMWNNGGVSVVSDAAGRYSLCAALNTKELTLVVEAEGYGSVETLAYLERSRDLDFVLEPAATVEGQAIKAQTTEPATGVKITLHPSGAANPNNPPVIGTQPVRIETLTDGQGRFHIAGLAAGRYRIEAVADGSLPAQTDAQLDLAAGEERRGLQVMMVDTALVEGTVRRNGMPAADVMLSFDVRGTPTVPQNHSVLYPFARSGPDGRYQVHLKQDAVVERILGAWPRNQAPPGFVVTGSKMHGVDINVP